jgi:hypothetical protein
LSNLAPKYFSKLQLENEMQTLKVMFKFKVAELICCLLRYALKVPHFCEVNFGHRYRHQ